MIHVEVRVDIDRPATEVFEYLEEVENNPRWLSGTRTARWTSRPPVRVGSTYEQVSQFLGREIRTSFEVTRHEPGRLVTIESREGSSFPIKVTRMVEPDAGGRARVTELVDGDAKGFYTLATPLLKRLVERTIRRDYRTLKKLLEANPSPLRGGYGRGYLPRLFIGRCCPSDLSKSACLCRPLPATSGNWSGSGRPGGRRGRGGRS